MHTIFSRILILSFLVFISPTIAVTVHAQEKTMEKASVLAQGNYAELPLLSADFALLKKGEAMRALFDYLKVLPDADFVTQNAEHAPLFKDLNTTNSLYPLVATLCKKRILTCGLDREFGENNIIGLPAFLKIFYELKYEQGMIAQKYSTANGPWYFPYMTEAKKTGLISENRQESAPFSRQQLFIVLYRDRVLANFKGHVPAYFHGLVMKDDEINDKNFYKPAQILQILGEYKKNSTYLSSVLPFESDAVKQDELSTAMSVLKSYEAKFQVLYEMISQNPLYYDQGYSVELREKFKKEGIKEFISEGYYDFHTSAGYRKHNIRAALAKFDGIVIQPEEELNYWKVMKEKGMGDIGNGWIISAGKEVWAWGGGLCGSATSLLRGAWSAGLDVTDRSPHSIYYVGMYSMKDVGLDAMVSLPGSNLVFKNTTGAPLMIHIKYDNADNSIVRVQMLGTKPFQEIKFSEAARERGYYVRTRTIEAKDGTKKEEKLYSSYRKFM